MANSLRKADRQAPEAFQGPGSNFSGSPLHEETVFDRRFGRIMNANVAEYHVPVNADIHDIKVIFVDEQDDTINRLGVKGVGEIGIVGVAAAIAITLDKLQR